MQTNTWDPLTFLLVCLGFFIFFIALMYSQGILWFQQENAEDSENWFTSFESKDLASGGRFRRYGRPVLVLILLHLISYPVVTNLVVLSPFQFVIFIFVFYLPTGAILEIILIAILWRIYSHPKNNKNIQPTDDPFHDAAQS